MGKIQNRIRNIIANNSSVNSNPNSSYKNKIRKIVEEYTPETTQTNGAQKVVSSGTPIDNSLSLNWKNKITDIDNKIKKLESTNINSLPVNNRASAVENIQTQLDTLRSTKKTYEKEYDNALKYGDKLQTWYSLPQKSDFAQKSQYVSTKQNLTDEQLKAQGYRKTEDGKSWMKIQGLGVQYYDGGGDKLYEYINDSASRSTQKTNAIASGQINTGFDSMGYDKLTDEEKSIYNYLYSTDKEQAEEFLKIISPTLQTRTLEEMQSRFEEIGSDNPIIASAISVGTNLKNAAMAPTKAVATATGIYGKNPWLDTYGVQTQAIRQAAGQKAGEAINVNVPFIDKNAGELLYSGAMSLADMGAALAIGGGSSRITQAIMSSSAGSSALSEAKSKGASDGKALILGLGSAFIEAATEKYSIDAIFKDPENAVKFFLENTLTEGVEEGASNIANVALDTIVSSLEGSKSDIEKDIDDLVNKNGISEKEATRQVLWSRVQDLGADVLVGSLSGAALSAPKSISYQHQENKVKKLAYDTIIRETDTEKLLDSVVDKPTASKAVKDISKTAFKAALLSSDTTKQSVVETMSERGYMPSMAMVKELKANTKSVELTKTGISDELISTVTQLADKLDTAFTAQWYAGEGAISARNASELYIKGVALGDAVSAVELASNSLNENLSKKQAEKTIKKAASMLPANIAPDISTGSISEKAEAVINAATEYISQMDAQTADVSQNYIGDIVSTINEAVADVELNQKVKTALSDMLTTGNVTDNLNEVLADETATDTLSKILGAHIDTDSKEPYIRRKVVDMLNVYKAGYGNAFSVVAKQKQELVNYFEQKLDKIGANSTVIKGFKNAVLNGKLSQFQAREIALDKSAFELYVKATAGRLGTNPTIADMINAAGFVGGFDLLGDISPYFDKGYSETVESDVLVPDSETGVYDAGTGTVILNKKAEPIKKLSYKLAQELLSDVANEHKTSDNVRYSTNGNLSVKEQINNNLDFLNSMDVVSTVNEDYIFENKQKAREWAISRFEKYNYKIFRDGFGEVIADKNRIGKSMRYYTTIEEIIAFDAVPQVIMHGVNIGKHPKHKGRDYDTITFAAPIIINGNRMNMAVVVRQEGNNYYKVHRVVMPDGSKVDVNKKRDDAGRAGGIISDSGLSPTDNVSINSISNSDENVNTLVNSVIDYMSANGYDLDSEVNRVIKKFNPYILEHRARLNSSLLSEQSLQREIAADFLTSVFSDSDIRNEFIKNAPELTKEIADKIKTVVAIERATTNDKQFERFAIGVYNSLVKTIEESNITDSDVIVFNKTYNYFEDTRTDAEVEDAIFANNLNRGGEKSRRKINASLSSRKFINHVFELFKIEGSEKRNVHEKMKAFMRYAVKNNVTQPDIDEMVDYLFDAGYADAQTMDEDAYGELRSYLKYTRIFVPERLRSSIPDYDELVKSSHGKINIASKQKQYDTSINEQYFTLQEKFGYGLFPDIDNDVDQLMHIFGIANVFLQNESTIKLSEFFKDEIKEAKDAYKGAFEEYLREYKSNYEVEKQRHDADAALNERTKENAKKKYENMEAKYKKRIKDIKDKRKRIDLEKRLLKQARRLNVLGKKQPLQKKLEIAELIGHIDLVSRNITNKKFEQLSEIAGWYSKIQAENLEYGVEIEDPKIENAIKRLGDKRISELSDIELLELVQVLQKIIHGINTKNKLLSDIKAKSIEDMSKQAITDVKNSIPLAKHTDNETSDVVNEKDKAKEKKTIGLVLGQLSPRHVLDRVGGYGDSILSQFGQKFQNAQAVEASVEKWGNDYFNEFISKKENRKWLKTASGKKAVLIETTINGKKYMLTPAMRASLYALSKSPGNIRKAQEGITIPSGESYIKGNLASAYETNGRIIQISPKELAELCQTFTPIEKEYAELSLRMNNDIAPYLNEVSLKLEGYEKFLMKNHIEVRTLRTFLESKNYTPKTPSGNISEEKTRNPDAKDPIVLEDLTLINQRTVSDYSKYIAYKSLIRDYNALMSFKKYEGNNSLGVKDVLSRHHGTNVERYMESFIERATGIRINKKAEGDFERFLSWVKGNFAKSVLTLNARSGLSQATAYINIASKLGYKAMLKGATHKTNTKTINKYTSVLFDRSLGFGVKTHSDLIEGSLGEKQLALFTDWNQRVDLFTVKQIWGACEAYIEEKYPSFAKGSDEYYKEVAKIYEETVYETQANYTEMNRADMLKNSSDLLKSLLMFKIEDFKTFGMLYDAHGRLAMASKQFKTNRNAQTESAYKEALSKYTRTVTSTLLQMVTYAAFRRLWAALSGNDDKYRDEEGKINIFKEVLNFLTDMGKSLSGLIAFGDTVLDIVMAFVFKDKAKYLDFDSPVLETITEAIQQIVESAPAIVNALIEKDVPASVRIRTVLSHTEKLATKFSAMLFGIPIKNIEKIILNGILRFFPEERYAVENYFNPYLKNDLSGIKESERDEAIKTILNNRDIDAFDDTIVELTRLYGVTLSRDIMPSNIPTQITVDEEQIVLSTAEQLEYKSAFANYCTDYLNNIVLSTIYKSMNDEQKINAISKIYSYAADEAKQTVVSEYDISGFAKNVITVEELGVDGYEYILADVYTSELKSGVNNDGKAIIGSLAKKKFATIDNFPISKNEKGVIAAVMLDTDEDVVDNMIRHDDLLYYYVKAKSNTGTYVTVLDKCGDALPGYVQNKKFSYIDNLQISEKEKGIIMTELFDTDKEKRITANLAGISNYDYYKFRAKTGVMSSDDSGRKKDKVLKYINSLDLTSVQKDILYYDAGYSTKTIYEAPWR